ncbi:hypothetical protein Hanom_Chr04g00357061 [Helianthus anomalus]
MNINKGRGWSLVIEFYHSQAPIKFAISATIFPSRTTFFSGGGHHSSPHPTISPQPTIHSQKNHNALKKSRKSDFVKLSRVILWSGGGRLTRYTCSRDSLTHRPGISNGNRYPHCIFVCICDYYAYGVWCV